MLRWVVRKVLGKDYYHRSELETLLDNTRRDERRLANEEWGERMEAERVRRERDVHLVLVEAENKVKRAEDAAAVFKRKMRAADDARFCAITGAQGNLHIASKLAVQVKELRDIVLKMSVSVEEVEDEASQKLRVLEKETSSF